MVPGMNTQSPVQRYVPVIPALGWEKRNGSISVVGCPGSIAETSSSRLKEKSGNH